MENMDQVIEQSTPTMDETQQEPEAAADEKQDAQTEQGAQKKADDAASHEDSEPDFQSLGEMSAGDQLAYLRQHGYLDHDADDEKPEQKQKQKGEQAGQAKEAPVEDDPEYEITVDGEPVKVKLSELKNGYQRQADYTRKTQALADERRQVDAMPPSRSSRGRRSRKPTRPIRSRVSQVTTRPPSHRQRRISVSRRASSTNSTRSTILLCSVSSSAILSSRPLSRPPRVQSSKRCVTS